MSTVNSIAVALALAGASGLMVAAQAQTTHTHDHGAAATVAKANPADMSEGEVRKIDVAAGKVTLKHGPLKNLDMPGMTMAFRVKDPALLAKLKVGDKVRFVAANPGGVLTIVEMQPGQ